VLISKLALPLVWLLHLPQHRKTGNQKSGYGVIPELMFFPGNSGTLPQQFRPTLFCATV